MNINKCGSCKSFFEPIKKPNGKYYKSCNRCLLKSKKKIDNIDNTIDNIDNTIDNTNNTIDNIETNNDIIDNYLNIIKIKNSIIEKLTTDNKNLNNIVNDYKMTLSQTQQTQQQITTKPNIKNNDDRLDDFIKQLMKK